MAFYFLAGVCDADILSKSLEPIRVGCRTLVETGITVATSNEEIRVGKGAQLAGRYFHTSGLTLNIVDGMFNLDFIALNTGSMKEVGGITFTEEQVTPEGDGSLTVVGTPVDFLGKGIVGYYAPAGTNDYTKIEFVGKTANAAGVKQGQNYCVKYVAQNKNLKQITIPASIIPQECIVVLKGDLFLGDDPTNVATATKVGYLEVVVPRFQPDGNMDFAMNMTGAAQTPLTGSALVAYDGEVSCGQSGYYARIKEVIMQDNWYDSLIAMAVNDSDIVLNAVGAGQTVVTYGIHSGLTASAVIPPEDLTYTLSDTTNFELEGNVVKVKGGASESSKGTLTVSVKGDGLPDRVKEIKAIADVSYTK